MSSKAEKAFLPEGNRGILDAPRANLALVSLWTRLSFSGSYQELHIVDGVYYARDRVPGEYKYSRFRKPPVYCNNSPLVHALGVQDRSLFLSEDFPTRLYDRALHAWRALGTTVLLHPHLLDETELLLGACRGTDIELFNSCRTFKYWFFTNSFKGMFRNEKGEIIAPNLSKIITLLKSCSAWMTYYGSFDYQRTEPPSRGISPLPGGIKSGNQVLGWFAGHLKAWREPWLLSPTKDSVFVLSQMSSFGRALPPASEDAILPKAKKCLEVLSTPGPVHEGRDRAFQRTAECIARRKTS